jgi:ABC-type Mn2+/Zn2+ transport system ATPase subunit
VQASANGRHNHYHATLSVVRPDAPIVLEVRGLSAGYPHDPALQGVSFAVRAGERVGLLGPNGAGKSTLFKAIMGILPATAGEVRIHDSAEPSAATRVAYVPQFEEIDWKFPVSVYDVVMMGRTRQIGWLRWARRGDAHDRSVREALARVQMLKFADRQIGELSGGQKRRVFIARALAQQADILLLDEPFAGVDARAQATIHEVIAALCAEGVTVLLATHDLGTASSQFDKLILLNRRMIAFGTSAEVFRPDVLGQTFGGQLAIWRPAATDGQQSEATIMFTDHCCP